MTEMCPAKYEEVHLGREGWRVDRGDFAAEFLGRKESKELEI